MQITSKFTTGIQVITKMAAIVIFIAIATTAAQVIAMTTTVRDIIIVSTTAVQFNILT